MYMDDSTVIISNIISHSLYVYHTMSAYTPPPIAKAFILAPRSAGVVARSQTEPFGRPVDHLKPSRRPSETPFANPRKPNPET